MARHIPALKKIDDVEIAAYFDMSEERARDCAQRFGGQFYTDYGKLLQDRNIDAIVICTPARSHCELSIKALKAGKHVLCEKPMAVHVEDAEKMVEAARETGKKLMVSHNQRRYLPHIKAKELLDKGEIGKLITYRTFLGIKGPEYSSVLGINNYYFDRNLSGFGVMSDVGAHRIDLMRYITGAEYRRVFCHAPTLAKCKADGSPVEVDDNAFIITEMENGVVGTIITSWTSMSGNDRMSMFFGSAGVMTLYGPNHPLVIEKFDGTVINYDFPYIPPQSETELTDIDNLFIECIKNDTEPFVTGYDGLAVARVLDAMKRSNLSGSWELVGK